jgi:hypothetical protein
LKKPSTGRGGIRANAGGKSKHVRDSTEESHIEYTASRAKKESFAAKMLEHNFNVESGKFVPRSEVQRAAAVAFATVTQTLRSIPDNLERRLGISPEIAEQIAFQIDEIMGDLADDLEKMHSTSAQVSVVGVDDDN